MRLVRTRPAAVAFVDRAGIALAFPRADLVLPSLWEAIAGTTDVRWADRRDDGTFDGFTPEMQRLWTWKDELPADRLACAGRYVRGQVTLVSLSLVPALYALTGRSGAAADFRDVELGPTERDIAEAVLSAGPSTQPELRAMLPMYDRKEIDRAVVRLHRALVLTSAGVRQQSAGWPAGVVDLLARRYAERLAPLTAPERARQELVASVARAAGEVSLEDVRAVFRWPKAEVTAALDALAESGHVRPVTGDGYALWRAARVR